MAQPIDPKSGHKSQSSGAGGQAKPSVDAFYHRAVAAFKAQNYDLALACFQRLGQLPPSSPYYLKALIGQVRVHQRLGQADQARRLCRQRVDSPSPQVRQWANRTLDQLAEKTAAPILSNPPEKHRLHRHKPRKHKPCKYKPTGD
jgi:tetratricopeptide (TPR) repeat protein